MYSFAVTMPILASLVIHSGCASLSTGSSGCGNGGYTGAPVPPATCLGSGFVACCSVIPSLQAGPCTSSMQRNRDAEEPDALFVLVRVCRGAVGYPAALPGKVMQTWEDSSGEAPERLELRRPGQVRKIALDDHRAHPGPKTGAFSRDYSNRDTRTEVALDAVHSRQMRGREAFGGGYRSRVPHKRWSGPSNAPDVAAERRSFRIIHPFHPLLGREFDLVNVSHCWGDDRVFYVDENDQVRALPARWTDVVADDPFVVISAGRSDFRIADLLELVELIAKASR